MSRFPRKAAFRICENKDAYQLRSYTAQFISAFVLATQIVQSLVVQPSLCWTWSETLKTGFGDAAHMSGSTMEPTSLHLC